MHVTEPKQVNLAYQGIKFQAGNTNSEESISIEIQGEYITGFLGEHDKFEGKILIDDLLLDYSAPPIELNLNETAELSFGQIYDGMSGHIYINKNLDKVIIEISELDENDNESFSYENGWFISAPAKNREEAIEITNSILSKIYNKNIIIY